MVLFCRWWVSCRLLCRKAREVNLFFIQDRRKSFLFPRQEVLRHCVPVYFHSQDKRKAYTRGLGDPVFMESLTSLFVPNLSDSYSREHSPSLELLRRNR